MDLSNFSKFKVVKNSKNKVVLKTKTVYLTVSEYADDKGKLRWLADIHPSLHLYSYESNANPDVAAKKAKEKLINNLKRILADLESDNKINMVEEYIEALKTLPDETFSDSRLNTKE